MGQLDDINVVSTPGADKTAVQAAIARVLPNGAEVVTGQTVVNEQESSINQALSFFSTALLVFAFISLFVGAFTIFNTFSITVGQRTRELALLRVVGASRRQVFRSVLGEAAIVGAVSSAVGVGLGVLAALGLEALLQRVRDHLAHRAARVRGPHRSRRPCRRDRGHGHLGSEPGAPCSAGPTGSRHHGPPGR